MLSIPHLRAEIEESGYVIVSVEDGRILHPPSSPGLVSPTALVVPVTDALKDVTPSGVVTGPIDRETTWRVAAVHLDGNTVSILDGGQIDVRDLYQAILDAGYRWRTHPFGELSQRSMVD